MTGSFEKSSGRADLVAHGEIVWYEQLALLEPWYLGDKARLRSPEPQTMSLTIVAVQEKKLKSKSELRPVYRIDVGDISPLRLAQS